MVDRLLIYGQFCCIGGMILTGSLLIICSVLTYFKFF